MEWNELTNELSVMQRRAFFNLALDLVKADNQIHRNEVTFLNELQRVCGIDSDELDMVHYLSLSDAISVLTSLSVEIRSKLLSVFESIIGVDSDIDVRENLLLGALKLCLGAESAEWSRVISSFEVDGECSSRQIVYLESHKCQAVHDVLDDPYDNLLITKALNDAGLDFFYLPNVVKELCESTDTDLLRRSIEFLVPSGDHSKLSNLHRLLSELNCSTFYKMISAHYKIYPNNVPFSSFLLVKVHEGYKLDDANVLRKSIDFLCIDVSCEIKRRVLQFVNLLERPVYQLSYEGYYRLLYDYLSSESKIMSSIVLNERYDFYLSDLNGQQIVFESSPQSRSFYLLLLFYGCTGISQSLFDESLLFLKSKECLRYVGEVNLDISALKLYLLRQNSAVSRLLYNLILIYENISSKSAVAPHFLKYIESILNHRSSLKNYINNGFAQVNGLANSDEYFVKFNKESRSYYLSISTSFFEVFEWDKDDVYPITDSNLWCNLR